MRGGVGHPFSDVFAILLKRLHEKSPLGATDPHRIFPVASEHKPEFFRDQRLDLLKLQFRIGPEHPLDYG